MLLLLCSQQKVLLLLKDAWTSEAAKRKKKPLWARSALPKQTQGRQDYAVGISVAAEIIILNPWPRCGPLLNFAEPMATFPELLLSSPTAKVSSRGPAG